MKEELSKIKKKLEKRLDRERYEHTLGVMYTSAALAMRYDSHIEKALTAGLLHDCAKCFSNTEKLKMCRKHGIPVSDTEEKNPGLLHAKLGAYLAEKEYHIKDEDILNAIAYHTTGRPDMSLLEKIVYISDYMEPGRVELPNMKEVRRLAFADIDECMHRILADSLVYLKSRDICIDVMTEKTYEYYKDLTEKRRREDGSVT